MASTLGSEKNELTLLLTVPLPLICGGNIEFVTKTNPKGPQIPPKVDNIRRIATHELVLSPSTLQLGNVNICWFHHQTKEAPTTPASANIVNKGRCCCSKDLAHIGSALAWN